MEISKVWASALLDLVLEEGVEPKVTAEVKDISLYVDEAEAFLRAVTVDKEAKKDLIDEAFRPEGALRNFLHLLVDKGRIGYLKDILSTYLHLVNAHYGIKEVTLMTARPLDKDDKERLKESLKTKLKAPIDFHEVIDEDLIAGIKLIVDDKVIDMSMRKKIADLRKTLLESW